MFPGLCVNVAEVVYAEVLRYAARGVLPAERVDPRQLWEAFDGDGYSALEAAVALERARAAVVPRFMAARALRAAA